jgi:adenylate kinase family enzyme
MPERFRRVLVVGISGAGKTTLAQLLAEATRLPLIHLDREHWLPGWQEPSRADWRGRVALLAAADAWIMDGNYTGSFDIRMPRADAIVWLDYRPVKCIVRVLRRVAANWGRSRADMAEGCPERLDRKFLLYIWRFRKKYRPHIERAIANFGVHAKVFRVTGDAEWIPLIAEIAKH